MKTGNMDGSFGEMVRTLRQDRGWTVKDLLHRLTATGQKSISPAYITRIEQYGDIPSPDFICRLADAFGMKPESLLEHAKKQKIAKFDEALEAKYQKAVGLYRTQKRHKEPMRE